MAHARHPRVPPPHPRKTPRFSGALTLERVGEIFAGCADYATRTVEAGGDGAPPITLCYLTGMVKLERISECPITMLGSGPARDQVMTIK